MSRKYPYDAKDENMRAHHYRSEHGWKDSYNGSHEGTLRLMNASRSKYGLPPISDAESRIDQPKSTLASLVTSSNDGAALVVIAASLALTAGAVAAGYFFGRKRPGKPKC